MKNSDLCVTLALTAGNAGPTKDYIFFEIEFSDQQGMYKFLTAKKININNLGRSVQMVMDRWSRGQGCGER